MVAVRNVANQRRVASQMLQMWRENIKQPSNRVGCTVDRIKLANRTDRTMRSTYLVVVGKIHLRSNQCNVLLVVDVTLPQACVQQGRLVAWIRADEQHQVRLLAGGNRRVEQIARAEVRPGAVGRELLLGAQRLRAEPVQQILQRHQRLRIGQPTRDGRHLALRSAPQRLRDRDERRFPLDRLQVAARVAQHRCDQPLALQPIAGEARLVRQPLLVDGVVFAGQNAQHLAGARAHHDVAAERVEHVDRFDFANFPRARHEAVRLVGERADRAQIDHVAGQLGQEELLHVRADLHIVAAARRAEIVDAGHLGREANAARAVDAPGHDGFDQRANILILDRALAGVVDVGEARPIGAERHRLVLQVALASLVADGAVERVVHQQELHDALARFARHLRVGLDAPALHHRHGAGGDRLGRLFHLHQAHATVAGHREPLVVAEAGNFDTNLRRSLQLPKKGGGWKRVSAKNHPLVRCEGVAHLQNRGARIHHHGLIVDEHFYLFRQLRWCGGRRAHDRLHRVPCPVGKGPRYWHSQHGFAETTTPGTFIDCERWLTCGHLRHCCQREM
uniref:Uncharacterized protein n=1 Tax=Anopheles atroparvus TaxID=41427 RepID=A0AAG5DV64_ANOAO